MGNRGHRRRLEAYAERTKQAEAELAFRLRMAFVRQPRRDPLPSRDVRLPSGRALGVQRVESVKAVGPARARCARSAYREREEAA